jgi:hypothetical protein
MTSDQDQAIEKVYKSLESRLINAPNYSIESFRDALRAWTVIPAYDDQDQVNGAAVVCGNIAHAGHLKPSYRTTKKYIGVLQDLLERYGSVRTTVMKDNPRGLEFCQRLGFEIVDETEQKYMMKMVNCRYV